ELRSAIEEEGSPVLSVEARSEKQEDAEKQASELYAQAREQADLPPHDAQVLGALSPIFAESPHERPMDEAATHLGQQRYELALSRAHTACELYGKLALAHFVRERAESDGRSFRGNSLARGDDQQLFRDLTGVEIETEAWWPAYRKHLDRRNEIVHEGIWVTECEAWESMDAAE